MADARRRSPLAHRSPAEAPAGAARLTERPLLGTLILRADHEAAAALATEAAGIELPAAPNRSSRAGTATVLWLGPDEWLLITQPGVEAGLLRELGAVLGDVHHQLVDVSDATTVIELSGNRAREMLMKLTTLDLHPKAFRVGVVAGSRFGKITATLYQSRDDGEDGGPAFELVVQSSLADYLWCQLALAGREFGMPPQEPRSGEALRP